MRRRQVLVLLCAALTLLLVAQSVDAKVFHCGAGDTDCLIAAVNAANSSGESTTIRLAEGTYAFTAALGSPPPRAALPTVSGILTIVGAGADATIIECSSGFCGRIIEVEAGGALKLQKLSIRNGDGGILNHGSTILAGC